MSWPGYVEMEGTWWPPKTAGRVPGRPGQYCQHSANGEGAEDTRMWWKYTTDLICGFSSKKLTEYKLIATNSSDRLRHVPNYFSIFFNKSACCLQKKKKPLFRVMERHDMTKINDKDKYKDNDKDKDSLRTPPKSNPRDLWHLRHWLQFWQLRTWIHDNLCDLTINCDTGQHLQFLRCFSPTFGRNQYWTYF